MLLRTHAFTKSTDGPIASRGSTRVLSPTTCSRVQRTLCRAHTLGMQIDLPEIPVDPVGEALHRLRLGGALYARCELSAPWGLDLPPMAPLLTFHVVLSGSCRLEMAGCEPRQLQRGTLALFPHGAGHTLCSDPGVFAVPLFESDREIVSNRYEVLRQHGGGEACELICGAVRFDHPGARQLIALLPPLIEVEASSLGRQDWLNSTLSLVIDEARELRVGGETVIRRLADVLVIQAIRTWIEKDPAARTGWLNALRDKQIGRAIALVHRDPARAWTLASLADAVAMSRTAFANRFVELVGMPVMQYITNWRMQIAFTMLQDRDARVADLAEHVGYQSEAAFSRAFKRFTGQSPGSVRRSGGMPT